MSYSVRIVSPVSGQWTGTITDIFCPDVSGGPMPVIRADVQGDFGMYEFVMASDGSCCLTPHDRRLHGILNYEPGELEVFYDIPEVSVLA